MGSATKKILLALEDGYLITHLRDYFTPLNFEIYVTSSGKKAVNLCHEKNPAIVIFNLELSDMDGIEACRQIREFSPNIPPHIVIISSHVEEYTEIAAFQNGVNDYVQKPLKTHAFLKRILAAWERIGEEEYPKKVLNVTPEFSLNSDLFIITIHGEDIQLPKKEFRLLEYLVRNPNVMLSRETILNDVWEDSVVVNERTVDVHITKIRQKIGGKYIESVKGKGYRFVIPEGG